MIKRFSVRNGFQKFENQHECQATTRNRLFHVFFQIFALPNIGKDEVIYDIVEESLAYFGQDYYMENDIGDHSSNVDKLEDFILHDCEWYEVYDFIEFVIQNSSQEASNSFIKKVNQVLEDETCYHVIDNLVLPIINPHEIKEIENAMLFSPAHVSILLEKALTLFSQRPIPDYNNAIKEAISAVEATCCTIAKDFGANDGVNTLGKALNYITDEKATHLTIELPKPLKNVIHQLYGFTSDEGGIRHGGTSYTEEDMETACFMIVTCSAILNLLRAKWEKAMEGKDV